MRHRNPRAGRACRALVVTLSAGLAILGCESAADTDDDGDGDTCVANLLPGDLVISEIMANPAGADEGQEWFEVYNATGQTLDLEGLQLVVSKPDLTGLKTHALPALTVTAGGYLVFGGMLEAIKPDFVDHVYVPDLGDLGNTSGRLALQCDDTLIDEATWADAPDGAALVLDGAVAPDAVANDDAENWCAAQQEYATDNAGSPGRANEACAGDIPPTACQDGDTVRDLVVPLVGDLVFTEFLANPNVVDDDDGEWFEVYVAADIDLNGLQLGKVDEGAPGEVEQQLGAPECLAVAAGTYLVFARNGDDMTNGGLPRVDHLFSFALNNSNKGLFLAYGGEVLDAIEYGSTSAGQSSALDPTMFDPTENDNRDYWCKAEIPYGTGDNTGSPGAANPSCGVVPEGQCLDAGVPRDKVVPAAGDLVFTEFMANPDGVGDTDGEWLELYVTRDVDLNGLELGRFDIDPDEGLREPETTLEEGDCVRVAAGSYALLARGADPLVNGGLPDVDALFDFSLNNSNKGLFVGLGGEVFDEISYTSTTAGAASSLDGAETPDAVFNDDAANWCPAVDVYGNADLGTPGVANPDCP